MAHGGFGGRSAETPRNHHQESIRQSMILGILQMTKTIKDLLDRDIYIKKLEWQDTFFNILMGERIFINFRILYEWLPGYLRKSYSKIPSLIHGIEKWEKFYESHGITHQFFDSPEEEKEYYKKIDPILWGIKEKIDFLPPERGIAYLTSEVMEEKKEDEDCFLRSALVLVWFQEVGIDPFQKLSEVVAELNWENHAQNVGYW